MPSVLLAEAVARFLSWAEVNLAARTVAVYRLYLRRFAAWAGNVPVADISPAMLRTWSTKFHPLQAVQRLAGWMHREERTLAVNPLAGMRKIPTGQRRRVLTPVESMQLLRSTDAVFRRFLLAMRESYARPQEIRDVTPADIRQAGGLPAAAAELLAGRAFFELERGKGFERRADQARVRIIPISPRLGRLLARLCRFMPAVDAPIFRDSRGRPWTANAVRCRMRRLRLVAGLGVDRRGERVVAYTMRHTGATAAAAAGLRDWTLAEVLGHASTRTTSRYVHLQASDVLAAMKGIWELKTGGKAKFDLPGSLRRSSEDTR